MEFDGKVVIITGASAGIGTVTARKFATLGANLAIVGRNTINLANIARSLDKINGGKTITIIADVSKDKDVERIVADTLAAFGRIDVLVNNAGFGNKAGILDGITPFDNLMATNVRGVYMLTSLAAPHIIKAKGNIVNVSSVASQNPVPNSLPYRISKAALDMFTKCVALELAPYGVRVNSVNPGVTRSQFTEAMGLSPEQAEAHYERAAHVLPLQRVSDGEEIADMIVYVASNSARGMTGSVTVVDNGHLLVGASFVTNESH